MEQVEMDRGETEDAEGSGDASEKLALEIRKLKIEIQSQSQLAALTASKLRLEAGKLQADLDRASKQDSLLEAKLKLEIKELGKSQWLRPGTMFPIVATAATIGFAAYQGVFNVARERLEVSAIRLQIDAGRLERQNADLRAQRTALDADIQKLNAEKTELKKTFEVLTQEKDSLTQRIAALSTHAAVTDRKLKAAELVVARAEKQARITYPVFKRNTLRTMAYAIRDTCLPRPASLLVEMPGEQPKEVRPRPEESSFLAVSERPCIEVTLRSNKAFNSLEEKDRTAFVGQLDALLQETQGARAVAVRAYSDPALPVPRWLFQMPNLVSSRIFAIIRNGERVSIALPEDEPRRSQWIEWRRRYSVESRFQTHAYSLLGKLIPDEVEALLETD